MAEYTVETGGTVEERTDVEVLPGGAAGLTGVGRVLVGIPAYNEAAAIAGVVERASAYADTVLVVDDGSSDDTARVASEAGASVVRHPENRGYGGALKTIFREAARRDPKHLAIVDADGQHDPRDVASLIGARADTQADLVIGSRYAGVESSIPTYRRAGLWVVNTATNLALGTARGARIRDTQSGLRAYGPRAYHSLARDRSIGDGMGASTDILHHVVRRGYRVVEVGVAIRYDLGDTSTENPVVHGVELVTNIGRLAASDRPAALVLLPAVAAALMGRSLTRDRARRLGRSAIAAIVGAVVGAALYLVLSIPRPEPEDAVPYELQVRRELFVDEADPETELDLE